VDAGLQQWYVLSELLFIVYMHSMYSHSEIDEGVTVGSCMINRLLLVDDLVLLASSQQRLQYALDRFSAVCGQAGMKITTEKAEVLCLSRNPMQ